MGVHTDAHLQLLHHLSRISDYTNVILMFIHSKLLRQCVVDCLSNTTQFPRGKLCGARFYHAGGRYGMFPQA